MGDTSTKHSSTTATLSLGEQEAAGAVYSRMRQFTRLCDLCDRDLPCEHYDRYGEVHKDQPEPFERPA